MIDARLVGKQDKLSGSYPLAAHLIDTGQMAATLWDEYLTASQRTLITSSLGVPHRHARALMMFWAGLHDLGKATPCFQRLVLADRDGLLREPSYSTPTTGVWSGYVHHAVATHLALPSLLINLGYPDEDLASSSLAHQVAQLLGGHHGRFPAMISAAWAHDPTRYEPRLGERAWSAERAELTSLIHAMAGQPPPPSQLMSPEATVAVAGIVIVADWLVSKVTFMEERRTSPAVIAEDWPRHSRGVSSRTSSLLNAAQLGHVRWKPIGDFTGMFPGIEIPNQLQSSLSEQLPGLAGGAGLLLITAPMGEGKTEAGWYGARILGDASGCPGLLTVTPTRAATDQMYRRLLEFASSNTDGQAPATLLHSLSWMNPDYTDPMTGGPVAYDGARRGGIAPARSWLRRFHQSILAPLAAATVDQLLLMALPVKFNAVRMFGVSGKAVVIDEAHALDVFSHGQLLIVLEWLGALGVPVVLLSATLTGTSAGSLVRAYRRGVGLEDSVEVIPNYPGWMHLDARSGVLTSSGTLPTSRRRHLTVNLHPVAYTHDARVPHGRAAALLKLLEPVVELGGVAMVACATVAAAQETYAMLARAWEEEPTAPSLMLLHARLPAWLRQKTMHECGRSFGRGEGARPARAVLVATSLIEQSVDMDFDLIISDMATMAQLLQRSGRVWRHEREARGGCASEPSLSVLIPVDVHGALEIPRSWGPVYDESLLLRTAELLAQRADRPIVIPDDVQTLIDAVYTEEFATAAAARLSAADGHRLVNERDHAALAAIVAVPPPRLVTDLHDLSNQDPDEELVTTRFGADSARLLPIFVANDVEFVDAECTVRLPVDDRLALLKLTVPVPGGWLSGDEDHLGLLHLTNRWQLEGVVLLRQEVTSSGVQPARIGRRLLRLDPVLGLVSALAA